MTNNFFGVRDLNGNCGSATGETITFGTVAIGTQTQISFDYEVIGFDNGDDVEYTVIFDGVPQTTVVLINGFSNFNASGTVNIPIPMGTNNVS
ncbi:hypothetical protein JCM19275_2085 [Nonlabens ulvanivorans]|uniref:Uncharacterized protein n=1 Tax=Nonlabens ulvanivorans TaxID=906888 RepID=A0A090WMV5_NONUL|nr:hypothetical protein [Nonlabens ulvanivorans]GAL76749.1 hypothetical protein JCM19275_2085 [Nonlabens ulvanivorans]